jgi:hypothetical protein
MFDAAVITFAPKPATGERTLQGPVRLKLRLARLIGAREWLVKRFGQLTSRLNTS